MNISEPDKIDHAVLTNPKQEMARLLQELAYYKDDYLRLHKVTVDRFEELARLRVNFEVLWAASDSMCFAFGQAHQPHHDSESAGWTLNAAWVNLTNVMKGIEKPQTVPPDDESARLREVAGEMKTALEEAEPIVDAAAQCEQSYNENIAPDARQFCDSNAQGAVKAALAKAREAGL